MKEILLNLLEKSTPWLMDNGIKILAIIIGAWVITKFGHFFVERIIRRAVKNHMSKEAEEKRENTLTAVFDSTIKVVVWIAAIIIILSELGINTAPILAGAGIVGLAFGFGGQYLIRDIISGFFIIIENQYRVGDIIEIDGVSGSVENINLRMTILRDVDGVVHYIPNGAIKTASNKSKGFSVVNLKIGISYDANIDKVEKVINEVGKKLAKDKEWENLIKKAPEFVRIEEFGDSAVIIKISCETKPSKQWDVAGELRKRIKVAFDKEGIEIPYPQVVEHQIRR